MSKSARDWSATQYLMFENERTRAALDLLSRVPVDNPGACIDLGCGPGNSTELLVGRFPDAVVEGLDSSSDMLAKARARLPGVRFEQADLLRWRPTHSYDLVFANAVLQWLPDHERLFPTLLDAVSPGGCLAVQMPDNVSEPSHLAMREVADSGPWADRLRAASEARTTIGSFEDYHRWLRAAGCEIDLWRTTYVHALAGAGAIVEWFKSTGLKPYIDPLSGSERAEFLDRYRARIAQSYPADAEGTVLLRFPRLFIVASKRI